MPSKMRGGMSFGSRAFTSPHVMRIPVGGEIWLLKTYTLILKNFEVGVTGQVANCIAMRTVMEREDDRIHGDLLSPLPETLIVTTINFFSGFESFTYQIVNETGLNDPLEGLS